MLTLFGPALVALAGAHWAGVPMHGSMRVLKLRNIAVHALSKSDDQTPIPARTSVYQTLSDSQITNIHDAADALFNVLDRNGDNSISEQEARILLC
uniref:EF-hand domain-containing protein n=1 Tax=Coccolithus braarudii TaxID=221442 RepID=A0A7S0PZ80_9EUKA